MRRSTLPAIVFCIAAMTPWAQAQTATPINESFEPRPLNNEQEDPIGLLQRLTVELRNLRFDLLKQQNEKQVSKIKQLRADLQQVEADRQGLQAAERALSQQMALLDRRLGEPVLVVEQRTEIEAAKTELAGNEPKRLQAEHQRMLQREAEVMAQLEEAHRDRRVLERASEIKAQSSEVPGGNPPENLCLLLKQLTAELEKMKFDLIRSRDAVVQSSSTSDQSGI